MEYQGFCIAEIGTNGTGKTRKAIEIIETKTFIHDSNFKDYYSKLVLVSDDSESFLKPITQITLEETANFKGWAKMEIDENIDDVFDFLFNNFSGAEHETGVYPSAIFIDDAMAILDTRNESVMRFFKKRRQRLCNIILNCHGASEFPLSLFKNMTDFLIFQTLDSLKNIEGRMTSDLAYSFRKAVEYVNTVSFFGNENQNDEILKKLKYFNFRFNMKAPARIEQIDHLINSKWWQNPETVKKYFS